MTKGICQIFVLFVLNIILFFFVPTSVLASTILFQDNFNDGNANGWDVVGSPGWAVVNGEYGIHLDPGLSNTVPADGIWDNNWRNFIYEVDLRGVFGTDKNILLRFQNPGNFAEIHHTGGSIHFEKVVNGVGYQIAPPVWYPLSNGPTYHFKFEIEVRNIKVYVDDNLIFDVTDADPFLEFGKVGLRAGTGAVRPTQVWFDNVVVTSVGEPEADPAILLLGLGASWNKDALICNAEVGWEDWEMTPGIHHYDGIIQTFQQALGEDFHVFFYDWTKPVDQIADDLKTFIDEVVNPPPGTEIDLVGHSLGGLVARAYLQKNPADHGIDQLLTLGSPHQGVPQVYYAWEGANFKKLLHPLEAYGAMLLIFGRRGPLESLVEVVQDEMPSLKDLLPIFPYLKKDPTGEIIPLGSMSQRNKWLPGLFPILANLLPRFNPLIGLAGDTTRWLRVVPRSWGDNLRGMWEDGRPSGEEYEMGDKTVLAESAGLDGASNTELSGLNHSELVTTVAGQEAVLDLLGITGVSPTPGATDFSTRAFVAALLPLVCPLAEASIASPPVGIRIIDPLGQTAGEGVPTTIPEAIYRPEDQLILIPGALEGNYQVEVVGNPGEDYHLVIGELGEAEDIWVDQREEIGSEGVDSYPTEFSQDAEEIEQNLLHLAKTKLQELQDWLASYPNTRVYRTIRQVIGTTIRMIEGAERYLEKNKTGKAKTSLRAAVLLIGTGQKYVPKFESAGLIPAEVAEKILFETTQSRDYLLQTLEILGE